MKKAITLFLICILCVSLAACQPTPDKPFVESKNDGELEGKLAQDPMPEKTYDAPKTLQCSLTNGDNTVTIDVDADIHVPDTTKYSVARVQKLQLTEEWVKDKILRLSNDGKIYTYKDETVYTKADVEEIIQSLMEEISNPNSDINSVSKSEEELQEAIAEKQDEIAAWKEYYKSAPDEFVSKEIDVEFADNGNGSSSFMCEIHTGKYDGAQVSVTKTQEGGYLRMSNFGPDDSWPGRVTTDTENMNGVSLTKDEAIKLGKEFIQSLGEDGFEASLVTAAFMDKSYTQEDEANDEYSECFDIFYTRSVENVPTTYCDDSNYITPATDALIEKAEMAEQYAPFWPQESIELMMNDSGVICMEWTMPAKQEQVINSNVQLLPFDEIQRIFQQQMTTQCLYTSANDDNVIHHDITITRVELGLMQIREKNSYDGLLMVPTWNFYGYETYTYEKQEEGGYKLDENNQYVNDQLIGHSFLTINAIDGSIINPGLGY